MCAMMDVIFFSESGRKRLAVIGCSLQGISILICLCLLTDFIVFFLFHPVSYFLNRAFINFLTAFVILAFFFHFYLLSYFLDQRSLGTRWTSLFQTNLLSILMLVYLTVNVASITIGILFQLFSLRDFDENFQKAIQNYEGQNNLDTQEKDKYFVDYIQFFYECCALKGFAQWMTDESLHLKRFTQQMTTQGEPQTCSRKKLILEDGKNVTGIFTCYIPASCCRLTSVDCTPYYTFLAPGNSLEKHVEWMEDAPKRFYTESCSVAFLKYCHKWTPLFFCTILFLLQIGSFITKRYLDTSVRNSFKLMKPLKTAPGWLLKYSDQSEKDHLATAKTKHEKELDFCDLYNKYITGGTKELPPMPSESSSARFKDPNSQKKELLAKMIEVHQGFWNKDVDGVEAWKFAMVYRHSPDTRLSDDDESSTSTSSSNSE